MEWLYEWRQHLGLTQTQLGDKSGIDPNMISRYERKTAVPTLDTIRRLALALNITVDELLNGPASDNWELRLVVSKTNEGGIVDMTTSKSSAVLNISDDAMAITLSAGYELWEDDSAFEELIDQLRRKRAVGLKTRREEW